MTTKLPVRQQGVSSSIESQLCSFGARLRNLRLQRGWTLEELAARGGLSKAHLSRLESGERQASIAVILTFSRVFNVSLASLFESPAPAQSSMTTPPCVVMRASDQVENMTNGLKYAPLSNAGRFFNLQPLRITISPSRSGSEHYHHDGEEWIYVLSGKLTLSLAGKTYDLEPGDAAHFESRLPHRLIARGDQDAQVLAVASTVSGSPITPHLPHQHRAIPAIGLLPLPKQKEVVAAVRPKKSLAKIHLKKYQR
jgi:quercetin dioxygenase-like cupin family protein/DNA-binding XRE family transcriptional regulator